MELATAIIAFLSATKSLVAALSVVIFTGLIVAILWLLKDRKRLINALGARDERINIFIKKFESSQKSVTEAMSSVKEVLIELRAIIKSR